MDGDNEKRFTHGLFWRLGRVSSGSMRTRKWGKEKLFRMTVADCDLLICGFSFHCCKLVVFSCHKIWKELKYTIL
jgi:hypothetical protein